MTQNESLEQTESKSAAAPIFRLIYRSHSLLPDKGIDGAQDDALLEILRVSRANNEKAGVTGALVSYDDWFAQVLEGPEPAVTALYEKIRADPRHDGVTIDTSGMAEGRLFNRWAMALVAEHHEPDVPLVATTGGLAQGAPWRVTTDQAGVLTRLRDLTRGYGKGS